MYNKFKNIFASLVIGLFIGGILSQIPLAYAVTGAVFDTVNRAYFVARSGYKMTIGTAGSDTFSLIASSTPVAVVDSTGITMQSGAQMKAIAASVMTPSTSSITPAAGFTLSERNTIIAAGAPTAAFVVLPAATSSVGKRFTLFNQGSNPVAIVPQTGAINVSAALTPFSCTTLKECQCTGLTTGVFGCSQQ